MGTDQSSQRNDRGRCVLVVDDDAATRTICAIELESEGFSVIEASDGREGLELALSERPKLVVTDVKMPRCDGFEAAEELKNRLENARDSGAVVLISTPGIIKISG